MEILQPQTWHANVFFLGVVWWGGIIKALHSASSASYCNHSNRKQITVSFKVFKNEIPFVTFDLFRGMTIEWLELQ